MTKWTAFATSMSPPEQHEAQITTAHSVLVSLGRAHEGSWLKGFCGSHVDSDELAVAGISLAGKTVYLYGDAARANDVVGRLQDAERVLVVRELCPNYPGSETASPPATTTLGRVPILANGLGVFYRRFFDPALGFYLRIVGEHTFQDLTESNRASKAHRTGIYLTPVTREGADLGFRLLRCSTNLAGPTENFGPTDHLIVDDLHRQLAHVLTSPAPLNHVLAQNYHNASATDHSWQTQAKIKAHSDKTKDMPRNGIMAFCTFYGGLKKLEPLDEWGFDYGYKQTSGLTKLHFRIKPSVREKSKADYPEQFSLTLYPGSVFMMPLSTNRLYTHEIRSSMLEADRLPTRLGYVVRCSATEAVHREGMTFLSRPAGLRKLETPTHEGMAELRRMYMEENKTDAFIDYGERFPFSMNAGDYRAPNV